MRSTEDYIFSVVVIAVITALFGGLFVMAIGGYSYEYRCKGPVVEKRLYVLGVPFGGFDPIDGDSAGACR